MALNIKAWNFLNKQNKGYRVFDGINFDDAIVSLEQELNIAYSADEWEVSGFISADTIFEVESVYDVLSKGSKERNTLFEALEILKVARIKQRELEKLV